MVYQTFGHSFELLALASLEVHVMAPGKFAAFDNLPDNANGNTIGSI